MLGKNFVNFLWLTFGLHDFYVHVHEEVLNNLAHGINILEVLNLLGRPHFSVGLKDFLENFLREV